MVNTDFIQVIQHLDNGKVRIYEIKDYHLGDEDDPLTTIELTGEISEVVE